MPNHAPISVRPVTNEDLPVLTGLNFAAIICLKCGLYEDGRAILDDAILVYGRLLPLLVSRYSLVVAERCVDAPSSMRALSDVFTPEELAIPIIRMVLHTLVIKGLSVLPGYRRQVEASVADLRLLLADPAQSQLHARAQVLLANAGQPVNVAA